MVRWLKLAILFLLLLSSPALATNWCNDANNQACFLMEDATTESNESTNSSDGLTVSSGDTIEQSTTKKFGTYSRDFELSDGDYLYQADGLSTDISGANQQVTVCAWARLESDTNVYMVIAGKYDYGSGNVQYYLNLDTANNRMMFAVSATGSTTVSTKGDSQIEIETWYHFCGVYDDVTIEVYLDGSNDQNTPTAHTTGIYDGTSGFAVGTYFNTYPTPRRFFDGLIDDVGVFDIALDSTDIDDITTNGLYEATAGGAPPQIW